MTRKQSKRKPHEFEKLPEFDRAMQKLVRVPKDEVKEREERGKAERQQADR